MEAYAWEESSASIAKRLGLDENEVIRFDTNTSPYTLDAVRQAIVGLQGMPLNEYPAPDYADLVEGISAYLQVDADQVVVGAGADEIIDVIAKAFLEAGGQSVISTPTYSMFRIASQSYGANATDVSRGPGFSLDVDAVVSAARNAKLVWICNPNSPTGNAEPLSKIRATVESTAATVVVDEAYGEFGGESAVPLTKQYDNIIVIRTLSKAFGLAGARVGYAVTNSDLAAELNNLRLPNSVSAPSAGLAEAALSPQGIRQMRENVTIITTERKRMAEALGNRFRPFPSETNFLLVDIGVNAGTVFDTLLSKGLVVRNVSQKPLTQNCLRITVRSPKENDRLLEALA